MSMILVNINKPVWGDKNLCIKMFYHETIQTLIDIFWNCPYIVIHHAFWLISSSRYRRLYSFALNCRPDITLLKTHQLYTMLNELDADNLIYGARCGTLGTDVFGINKNGKIVATLSICTC